MCVCVFLLFSGIQGCYLNLFLNVLNMRTNLPLGEATMNSFLGVFKWGHTSDPTEAYPLFTRQQRKSVSSLSDGT